MMKIIAYALSLFTLFALPLSAGEKAPVSVQVLQGWQLPDGRRVAALQLTLDQGWKTYWRAPGDSGIPPRFDWKGARNIENMHITWPQPKVFHDQGMRSIGYKDQLVIPLHISPKRADKSIRLKGRMEIGICADVCAPFTLTFDSPLDKTARLTPSPVIASAMASAPFSAREAGVQRVTCKITPLQNGMQIETRITMPPAGATEDVVIEAGEEDIWVSTPQSRREGKHIIATSRLHHATGTAFAINRSALRITVLGSDHAVDIRGCSAG